MAKTWPPYLAEFIGTFALVFVSAGAVIAGHLDASQPGLNVVGIALAAGFLYAVGLSATLEISGGCLNPAVTIAFWVFKRLDLSKAAGLIAAQLLGAALAGLVLRATFSDTPGNVLDRARGGTPHLNLPAFGSEPSLKRPDDASPRIIGERRNEEPSLKMLLAGIGIELVLTFILTFAIYATLLDPRAPPLGGLGPGLALTGLVLVGLPLTGAALNPARWFGTFIWEWTYRPDAYVDHPIYWIGPTLGALLAAAVYEYLLWPDIDVESISDDGSKSIRKT